MQQPRTCMQTRAVVCFIAPAIGMRSACLLFDSLRCALQAVVRNTMSEVSGMIAQEEAPRLAPCVPGVWPSHQRPKWGVLEPQSTCTSMYPYPPPASRMDEIEAFPAKPKWYSPGAGNLC